MIVFQSVHWYEIFVDMRIKYVYTKSEENLLLLCWRYLIFLHSSLTLNCMGNFRIIYSYDGLSIE